MEPILVCKEVSTAYRPVLQRPILQSISFSVNSGEFVALLGLNGAGKSTLLRVLTGLVPLEQGTVSIQGVTLSPRALPQIRKHIGMLFQGGGLVPQLSALDNVLCGRLGELKFWETFWGFSIADRRRALTLLANLGLEAQSYQRTSQLSGGQRQRVAIARALLQSPKVLLVDEPVTGLDILATQQVMGELRNLRENQGMTIVAVLHDLSLAQQYCDRAIVLERGQIVYDGLCNKAAAQCLQSGLAVV